MTERTCETCTHHQFVVIRAMGATVRTCGCDREPTSAQDLRDIADDHMRGCSAVSEYNSECGHWKARP